MFRLLLAKLCDKLPKVKGVRDEASRYTVSWLKL